MKQIAEVRISYSWEIGLCPKCKSAREGWVPAGINLGQYSRPFQLLEFQTNVRRCRFDSLGKSTPAHCEGAPTAREGWVCSRTVGETDSPIATAQYVFCAVFFSTPLNIYLSRLVGVRGKYTCLSFSDFQTLDP